MGRYDDFMGPLSPRELAEFARQFAIEEMLIGEGRKVSDQINSHLKLLAATQSKSERERVLEALGSSIAENLRRYRVGGELTLIAWTTRNILELETTLEYVTQSPENLKSFTDDLILDEIEVREVGANLGFDRANADVIRRQDEAIARLRDLKETLGLTRKHPMRGSEMARSISDELGIEYRRFDKLYSKLVHPTAYLLLGGKLESTNWNAYSMYMMFQGVKRAEKVLSKWRNELASR